MSYGPVKDFAPITMIEQSPNLIAVHPTGRPLRYAELYEIGGGSAEIRCILIGREIFDATA